MPAGMRIASTIADINRLREILQVLVRYGLEYWLIGCI